MNNFMKRFIAVMIAATLILSVFSVAAVAMGQKTFYTTGKCHMRTEPDKNSSKILTIPKGKEFVADHFETDSRGVTWEYGEYKGQWGWVSEKNLSENAPKPTKKPSPTSSPSHKKYVKITGSCNIRKSPSLDGKKLGTASNGEYYKCKDAATDDRGVVWYKINYNGNSGWVSSKYAKTTNSGGETPDVTPKPIDYSSFTAAEYYVQVTSSTLNMRFEPSTDSSVIAVYNNGDVLYAIQTNGSWYHVIDEESNRSGYIFAKYAVQYEEPTVTDPETEASTTGVVNNMEELQAACPNAALINVPDGAINVEYSWHYLGIKDVTAAQIKFDFEGITYTLRAAFCNEVTDMIDIDNNNTAPEAESGDLHVVVSTDDTSMAIAHWYNADYKTQYSLCGPSANGGALVQSMAEKLIATVPNTAAAQQDTAA